MPRPRSLDSDDWFSVPIFIQNFNQVSFIRKQIDWLLRAGYRDIIVIDNNSTYRPLLAYYDTMTASGLIRVVRRPDNIEKRPLWSEHLLERFRVTGPFVFTSSDIVPDECCPTDVVAHLAAQLLAYPQVVKAGLGLRIDDLPAFYRHRQAVIAWERRFWTTPLADGVFLAKVDGTFALYRPGAHFALSPAVRTGWPYIARHEPWYADSDNPTEEARQYEAALPSDRGHWGREQLPEWLSASVATGRPTWPRRHSSLREALSRLWCAVKSFAAQGFSWIARLLDTPRTM